MSITESYGTILTLNKPDQTVLENIIDKNPKKVDQKVSLASSTTEMFSRQSNNWLLGAKTEHGPFVF